ncbi:ribonuclease activity regulator RraA [Puniceibacterium sp. IMCC21224]|uniref:ribonuclease activity regulator RraA n=1 Tax=Puniceibacterium sp. IMCC21224 TaxID=1618204 RepID=UPI00064DD27C|nr:ribonuclease activity regulator RraA [Puniceibacterium sp. IMCC21224]KMK69046.1 Demethylmenaquinone methyltransferase [Puniceibacterium sp. IMCC21224]
MTYAEQLAALTEVSTATITTVLLKKGLRNISLRGPSPRLPGQPRIAGPAFTMRFVPMREDLATPAAWSSPTSTRVAVERAAPGSIVVAGALGHLDSGIFGDILCARLKQVGAAGLVTDGAIRDIVGIKESGLPVWASAVAAPPAISGLSFVGWDQAISCGGVAVFPGDFIVADEDGAVVIPKDLLPDVVEVSLQQEAEEAWILERVLGGAPLSGLYPMNAETRDTYMKQSKKKK